jgi:hypothetical protein
MTAREATLAEPSEAAPFAPDPAIAQAALAQHSGLDRATGAFSKSSRSALCMFTLGR